jgi:hypothetical protein
MQSASKRRCVMPHSPKKGAVVVAQGNASARFSLWEMDICRDEVCLKAAWRRCGGGERWHIRNILWRY